MSKEELAELVLTLHRPAKTSRTSSKPSASDRKERREKSRPGGPKPGHERRKCLSCGEKLPADRPAEVVNMTIWPGRSRPRRAGRDQLLTFVVFPGGGGPDEHRLRTRPAAGGDPAQGHERLSGDGVAKGETDMRTVAATAAIRAKVPPNATLLATITA